MRRTHRASSAAMMVTLTCLLHGCADRSDASIFFPLAAGMTWQYRVERTTTDGTRELRQIISTEHPSGRADKSQALRVTSDGRRYFYETGSAGIFRVATERRDRDRLFVDRERVLVLPSPLHLESAWQSTSLTATLESSGPPWESLFRVSVPIAMQYRVEALDATIETPAGEFDSCLVISGVGKQEADAGHYLGIVTIEIRTTEWFAPGVGLVRSERSEDTNSEILKPGRLIMELDRWHLD